MEKSYQLLLAMDLYISRHCTLRKCNLRRNLSKLIKHFKNIFISTNTKICQIINYYSIALNNRI